MLHKTPLAWILVALAIKGDTPRNTLNGIRNCDLLQFPRQFRWSDSTLPGEYLLSAMKQSQHRIVAKHSVGFDAGKASRSREGAKIILVFLKERRFRISVIPFVWRGESCKVDVMHIWKRFRISICVSKCIPSNDK